MGLPASPLTQSVRPQHSRCVLPCRAAAATEAPPARAERVRRTYLGAEHFVTGISSLSSLLLPLWLHARLKLRQVEGALALSNKQSFLSLLSLCADISMALGYSLLGVSQQEQSPCQTPALDRGVAGCENLKIDPAPGRRARQSRCCCVRCAATRWSGRRCG